MKSKTLTLKQPFAELILQGKKKIELRKWNTNFRGEFFIHTSKIPDKKSMEKFGFDSKDLLNGFIVGSAVLKEVKKYGSKKEVDEDKKLHLADSSWGKYGFVLKEVKRFKEPIPAKGSLNFWDFEI